MRDLEREVGPIWSESVHNQSLANTNLTLSEPSILSRMARGGDLGDMGGHWKYVRCDVFGALNTICHIEEVLT